MAIVNRTPDSFFDQGATFEDTQAMQRVDMVVSQGADIVDIGGVKAGPGDDVDTKEELRRVIPFIEAVRQAYPHLIISVDTWRAQVADQACQAGADLINDTWAGYDREVIDVAASHGAGIVCSHTGGALPRTPPLRVLYDDVVAAVIDETTSAAQRALDAGITRENIVIDPTHDFGKNTFHGLEILRRTPELVNTGYPVLMALSNKDFVGETLDVDVDQRVEGTLAATSVAALAGARIFRSHHVLETRRAVDMVAAIRGQYMPRKPVRGLE